MFKKKLKKKCYNPLCLKYDDEVDSSVEFCPECNEKTNEVKNSAKNRLLPIVLSIISVFSILALLIIFVTLQIQGSSSKYIQAKVETPATPVVVAEVPPEIILRIHGSNTIGSKLCPTTAEEFLKKKGATDVKIVTSKTADEMTVVGSINGKSQGIEIFAHGSATAFQDMEKITCDIGMSSRKINSEESDKLNKAGLGILTSSSSEYILGLDGIAIIVNSSNSISKLTTDQINQIFSGKITDWAQLGGSSGTINVYARDDKSGTFDTFKTLILGTVPLVQNAKRFEDSSILSDAISKDSNGIGFIGLPYINNSKAVAVTENTSVAPFLPTIFTVGTEDYALTRRLYYYYSTQSKNTFAKEFIEFALSGDGQKIVADTGFVSQDIKIDKSNDIVQSTWQNAQSKEKFNSLIGTSPQRFSLSFRFDSASASPDNKSLRDLDRLVQYLNQNKEYKILLLGFSDSVGNYDTNVNLSQNRTTSIKEQLISRDPSLASRLISAGFGSEQPIASNDTEEGKLKNRRVEVWLTK